MKPINLAVQQAQYLSQSSTANAQSLYGNQVNNSVIVGMQSNKDYATAQTTSGGKVQNFGQHKREMSHDNFASIKK